MKFHPIDVNFFSLVKMGFSFTFSDKNVRRFNFLDIGKQIVGIEFSTKKKKKKIVISDHWVLRDNGSGSIAKTWDHLIFLAERRNSIYRRGFNSMLVFSHY